MILHQRDWCRANGFVLDPSLIPPDDAAQDAQCALAAAVEHARIDCGLMVVETGAGSDGLMGLASSTMVDDSVSPKAGWPPEGCLTSDRSPHLLDDAPVPAPAGFVTGAAASSAGMEGSPTLGMLALLRPVGERPAGAWSMWSEARL